MEGVLGSPRQARAGSKGPVVVWCKESWHTGKHVKGGMGNWGRCSGKAMSKPTCLWVVVVVGKGQVGAQVKGRSKKVGPRQV